MVNPAIVVVTRKTRLSGLRERFATVRQAKFWLKRAALQEYARRADQAPRSRERTAAEVVEEEQELDELADAAVGEYTAEDQQYQSAVDRVERELGELDRPVKMLDRTLVPTFDFHGCAAVVCLGQDGLVANVAKYAGDLPIVGVNPDPARFDGVLLPFQVHQAKGAVECTVNRAARLREVTLAETLLADGQRLLAFNDFFIGAASHVSARYTLHTGEREESQSSSGVIVSTGAGSTGWLSSVFNMAQGIAAFRGAEKPAPFAWPWEERRLMWVVREPFSSRQSGADLVAGQIGPGQELVLESAMPEGGVIFSDGIEADALAFSSGVVARIRIAQQRARLVGK